MQFNAVAETNLAAVGLYRSVGFSIAGTVPEAFDHPDHGLGTPQAEYALAVNGERREAVVVQLGSGEEWNRIWR